MRCPRCGEPGQKVIYAGLPMKLCSDETCCAGWGFWSWVPTIFFTGWFMIYEGSYWVALWAWIFGDGE